MTAANANGFNKILQIINDQNNAQGIALFNDLIVMFIQYSKSIGSLGHLVEDLQRFVREINNFKIDGRYKKQNSMDPNVLDTETTQSNKYPKDEKKGTGKK